MKTIVLSNRVICLASVMQVAATYNAPGHRRNVSIVLFTSLNGDIQSQSVITNRTNHFIATNNWK